MTYNVRNIVIALVLAVIAAGVVIMYTGKVQQQAHKSQETVTVLVAAADIPAGTTAQDAISHGQLATKSIVTQDEIPGALQSTDDIDGTYVASGPLFQGQQIVGGMFVPSATTGVATRLHDNYRAIEIPLDPNSMLYGTLKAGDHVDVIGVYTLHSTSGGSDTDVSRIIARDVPVMQAPVVDTSSGSKLAGGSSEKQSVILQVTDTVAPKITLTLLKGDVYLALQPSSCWSGANANSATPAPNCDTPVPFLATPYTVLLDGLSNQQVGIATGNQIGGHK
jgi:Flp pilus assembly protein CpaB